MGVLAITVLALLVFAIIFLGASKSDSEVLKALEHKGKLCLGTVLDYDSDDIATVEFLPTGSATALRTSGIGHFQKKHFPPGAKVAVLYNPLCPTVNRVVPHRTREVQEQESHKSNG